MPTGTPPECNAPPELVKDRDYHHPHTVPGLSVERCWYCRNPLNDGHHDSMLFRGIKIIACPEHPPMAGWTCLNAQYLVTDDFTPC